MISDPQIDMKIIKLRALYHAVLKNIPDDWSIQYWSPNLQKYITINKTHLFTTMSEYSVSQERNNCKKYAREWCGYLNLVYKQLLQFEKS